MKRIQEILLATALAASPAMAIEAESGDSGLGHTNVQPATIRANTSASSGGIIVPLILLVILAATVAAD